MNNKEKLIADTNHWNAIVNKSYLNGMGINWTSIRNVMDMKSIYGGYASETTWFYVRCSNKWAAFFFDTTRNLNISKKVYASGTNVDQIHVPFCWYLVHHYIFNTHNFIPLHGFQHLVRNMNKTKLITLLWKYRLAAALSKHNVWVMNVVPVHAPDTLPIIFERGFFGVYHDWCESFGTYPRTYDLLHADHLFSRLKNRYWGNLTSIVVLIDFLMFFHICRKLFS